MKSAKLFDANDIRLVDLPVRVLQRDEVLCKVIRTGICGTDYAIYTGDFSFVKKGMVPFPMTLGHEWSGVIEKQVLMLKTSIQATGLLAILLYHAVLRKK